VEEMTETEIRKTIAAARADLAAASREKEALRERRPAMLLSASVDEIIALDDAVWALNIAIEIAQAKIAKLGPELACIEREQARWLGVAMPSDEQLRRLLALVETEHPRLLDRNPNAYISRNFAGEFKSAFYALGLITRLAEPTQKIAFSTHVDRINGLLRRRGHTEVEGDVVLASVIAWGDCGYRLQDLRYGQTTECALDPLHNTGRAPSPVWREILAGRSLPKALPPRAVADRTIGLVRAVGG
jgi:hypothetical protein